ncbi:CyP450 monooxygenase [Daedaleopsis nitida]|nr:CyP450 monooxygenase [Daedaleopsis nitida]
MPQHGADGFTLLLLFFVLVTVLFLRRRVRLGSHPWPLPPGPRGWPIIGNALDFPKDNLGRGLRDICAQYGELVHIKILGQDIIVLGSYETACELLDKRSSIYSDRPDFIMGRLTSFTEWSLPVLRYGPLWRTHRRIFHQELLVNAIVRYEDVQRGVARRILRNFLDSPQRFRKHLEAAFSGTALRIAYGLEVSEEDDTYVRALREMLDAGTAFAVPGKYLVEVLPILQYLPGCLPGAAFKREAAAASKRMRAILQELFQAGKDNMEHGTARDSILTRILQHRAGIDQRAMAEREEICAEVAATLYTAGAETTAATLEAFILAMALFPEVQEKAQDELDVVVGRLRLPDFSDRPSLPYINALCKELVRWHIVAPTAVPHTTIRDDEFRGYWIPKGSLVIPNLWAYSRDPDIYSNPEDFDPDRFIKDGKPNGRVRNPHDFVFGFGRRICPGRHLADASLFMMCASILHIFSITPAKGEDGKPISLEAKFTTHLITSHAEEFQCEIRPRSAETAALATSAV